MDSIPISSQPVFTDSSSRYYLSNFLRDAISSKDFSVFMEDVDRFLTKDETIFVVVNGLKGGSKAHLTDILRIISNATLGWHKPFECLTVSEFTQFRSASGTFTIATMGIATVHRCLRVLEREHLICKFSRGLGYPLYYGLNLVEVFNRLTCLNEIEVFNSKLETKVNLFERLSDSPFLSIFDTIVTRLADRVFKTEVEFKDFISAHLGEIMGNLEKSLRRAKQKAVEVSDAKKQALASQTYFKEDGTPNPRAALAFWYQEIKDTELYSVPIPQNTGKLLGQMKYYLQECANAGLNEGQIRKNFHEFVNRWHYIPDSKRIFSVLSKNDKPYTVRVPGFPDFAFFYANRHAISQILMQTPLPGCTPEGYERISLDDVRRIKR